MYWNETINLISVVKGVDANGFPTVTPTSTTVYCNVLSIKGVEFYSAKLAGIKLEHTFQVHVADYNLEDRIEFNSITYRVERTYKVGLDIIEIMVSDLKSGSDA